MYSSSFETHKLGSEIKPENSLVKLDIDEPSKILLQDLFNKNSFSY